MSIMEEYLESEHGTKRSWHKKKPGVYHASSSGKCLRRRYYEFKQNISADAEAYGNFQLGHRLEEIYLDALREKFGHHYVKTDVPIRINLKNCYIKGETDPVIIGDNWEIKDMYEVKTTAWIDYKQDEPDKKHVYQTHCYMYALGLDSCHIAYMDKKGLDTVVHQVEFDQSIFDEIIMKTNLLHQALLNDEPPDVQDESEHDRFCAVEDQEVCCQNQ